jgi:hypothetical protein
MTDRSDQARAGDAPEGEPRARRRRRPARPEAPAPDEAKASEASEGAAKASSAGGDAEPAPPARGVAFWLRHFFVEGPSVGELLREAYLTVDRRTLGFARILFGFLLLTDLFRRTADWTYMFGDHGVLPAPLNLSRPQAPGAFSVVSAFVTTPELVALWILIFVTYVCVLVGYRTRLAQVLTVFWVASMNGRVLLIENGGYVVFNLLAMWSAFLPLGDRFSVDAWRESMRRKRETTAAALNDRSDLVPEDQLKPHVSLAMLAILLQCAAIYFFNVVHKTGPSWRRDFTAVHYVLYVDRMVNPLVGATREALPFWSLTALTRLVVGAEAALPFCLLSPLAKRWARLTGVVLMCFLHVGFGTCFVLGPFAWSLCVFSTFLFGTEDWHDAARTMRRSHRARTVLFDPRSNGALLAARSLARLDRFELLTFEERPGLASGVAIAGPGGKPVHGAAGFGQIVAAMPLGPCVAWLFRAPLIGGALDALVRHFESGKVSRFFGVAHPAAEAPDTGPSPLRRTARKGIAVLRELAVVAMLAGAVNQALVELWVSREKWPQFIAQLNANPVIKDQGWHLSPQPEATRLLAHKLRYLQGWFMFSPNPVADDGTIVVDALTVDGRHIDTFTGKPPRFDLEVKSFGYNQIWSDYFNRIRGQGNTPYRDALRQFILYYPERTGRPEDEIVSGDVYWLEDQNPRFGDPAHKNYGFHQNKLFSFDRERLIPPR